MDGDYDDPGPDNTLGPANPSIPMTSAMTTGTSCSMPQPLDRGRRASEPRAHQLAQSDHQPRHRCVGTAEVFDKGALRQRR